MARRENCVHCLLATAAKQPTAADYCRQCGRSTDLEGVATVDGNVLVSAVTDTLYERCNLQIPHGGRTAATGTFKNVPIDLVSAFCDAKPWLWRKMTVRSTASRRRVKYVTTRMEGTT
jgi:ribosomal protein L40E